MKIKILIIALFAVGTFSCMQRTCPTYTKDDVKKVEKTEQDV
jgi:hypothetical protein